MSATAFPSGYSARGEVTTTESPHITVGHVVVYFNGSTSPTGFCSGVTVGGRFVGTAGHCVYQASRGWATRIDYIPAQIKSTTGATGGVHPYGTCYADTLFTVRGWKERAKPSHDYGGFRIGRCSRGDREIGTRTGSAGFHTSSNESVIGLDIRIHGYPSGAPLYKAPGTMWTGVGEIYRSGTHALYISIETAGGDSGGPAARYLDACGYCVYGVHRGLEGNESVSRRLTNGMFNNWKDWRTR